MMKAYSLLFISSHSSFYSLAFPLSQISSWGKFTLSYNIIRSIEEITSQTKLVKLRDENGEFKELKVNIWNPTLANLSLMALGSSAPEILLSVIETCQTLGKEPGQLGPSTIVGSAAYNLLVISGISVVAVKTGTVKHLNLPILSLFLKYKLISCSSLIQLF